MTDLYVSDTILYYSKRKDICRIHTKTRERPRLTDGVKRPVKVTKVSQEEMEKLWK